MACTLLLVAGLWAFDEPPKGKSPEDEVAAAGREVLGAKHQSLAQCLQIAMKEVEKGVPVDIKAEVHGTQKVFGTYLLKEERVFEVEVDVTTAKVVKMKEKNVTEERLSQYKMMAAKNRVSFARAMKLAEEKCKNGKAIRVRLEDKVEKEVRQLRIGVYMLDGDKLVEVELNGEQGEILAVKERLLR